MVILFLFEFTFTVSSPLGHFGRFSRRSLQLYVRALSISLITIANISDCNLYPSATARLFCHKERRFVFDVDWLRQLAVEAVNQSIANIIKVCRGGFNRTFLRRPADGLPSSIPYDCPKYYAVASEVANIEYMCSFVLPVPKIYRYSPDSDNAAGTGHILMEFVQGSKLSEIWRDINDEEVISVIRQLTQLESRMISLSLSAGGSLYLSKDLDKVTMGPGVLLDDKDFCIGPDTRLPLWYGRRAKLEGPCRSFSVFS